MMIGLAGFVVAVLGVLVILLFGANGHRTHLLNDSDEIGILFILIGSGLFIWNVAKLVWEVCFGN